MSYLDVLASGGSGSGGMGSMPGMGGGTGSMPGMGGSSGPMRMPSAPPTLARLLAWHPQPIPVFPGLCLLAALLYGAGVVRLRRRGDAWPIGRGIAFALGLLLVLAMTGTGIGGYGMELLSIHMVQHMTLSMLAPIPLLLGAPVTLALRALRPAGRGARARANCCSRSCTPAMQPRSPLRSSPSRC